MLPARTANGDATGIFDEIEGSRTAVKKPGMLGKTLPESRWGGAISAILLPLPFALVLTALCTRALQQYGWSLFVGIPFVLPMISVVLYGYHRPRPLADCLWLGMVWLGVAYGALLVVAFEGVICLAMALPLAIPVVLLGSAVGYLIQARPLGASETKTLLLLLIAALPAMIGAEAVNRPDAPLFAVHTSVEVDATPDRVWRHVIRFDPLPAPNAWEFRTGLAYPVRAEIDGNGVGAIRRCVFSTGPFIEPIEVWDEPRLLRFAVTSNPPPMREWNPFTEIHPAHLSGFLVAYRGQFRLTEIAGGRTLLEGTTWYRHHFWPITYWQLWSDAIIHRIHQSVLEHIKRSVERNRS
jgi:Polyketide cyclase / dehydrase and lipid transport